MKTFEMTHLMFETGTVETFTEETVPEWLTCKENRWWYEGHVLTLDIGESIDSDFRRITRVDDEGDAYDRAMKGIGFHGSLCQ